MPRSAHGKGMTLAELAMRASAELVGDGAVIVDRIATLADAGPGAISFLSNPHYRKDLATTAASAVVIHPDVAAATALPKLVSANPYATYAKVASLLNPERPTAPGVHASAVVALTTRVPASASIGACVVLGEDVVVGEGVVLGAGVSIGDDCTIGRDTHFHANAVMYARSAIGARCIVHSGAVIGADGFGMAEEAGRWIKVPQLGRVIVGDDVEIGANTTIDRGAIGDTIIGDDVKLDNQIQIGHNCRIGAHTAIAGCVGVAGSVIIGRNCQIGGAAMISGHLSIVDGVTISAATGVFDSITTPGIYTGTFPALPHREWRYVASTVRHLREFAQRVRALERSALHKGEE